MPQYHSIRQWADAAARERAVERLLALRERLRTEIWPHRSDDSLLLATWNLRDFDCNRFGHGFRLPEAFLYIAEIVSSFDLVALQEVNRDLDGLHKLLAVLEPHWDYIVTDTTEGRGGNAERLAFLFDRRKVRFRNIAGEVVLPSGQEVVGGAGGPDGGGKRVQFARSPFVVAFQAGWFKFNLCTVHVYYGDDRGARFERRVDEIAKIAAFFRKRQEKEQEDFILLGDFNIVERGDPTMQALLDGGFQIPEGIRLLASNLDRDRFYDQIAFRVREKRVEVLGSGCFDWRACVYRDEDFAGYFDHMPADKRDVHYRGAMRGQPRDAAAQADYYREEWRTWQISDHLPLWAALKIDFTEDYLASLGPGGAPLT